MKRLMLVLLVVFIGCGGTITNTTPQFDYGKGADYQGTSDGTLCFWLTSGTPVQLNGVKIPAPGKEYWAVSQNFFRSLIKGKRVKLEYDQVLTSNIYRLAYVYVDDVMVNAEMIRRGYAYAVPTPPNTRYDEMFQDLETEAAAQKKGMWLHQDEGLDGLF